MNKTRVALYKFFKNSWSYVAGAILLSIFQVITFITTGNPWGVTAAFINWGGWVYESLGGSVTNWLYFQDIGILDTFQGGLFQDPVSLRNIGIMLGAFLATLLASQFRIKKIKSLKHVIGAALGGLIMGYGSSIAAGCNIGNFYSGIASLSLSGWVFGLFMFIGGIIGSKLFIKYLL